MSVKNNIMKYCQQTTIKNEIRTSSLTPYQSTETRPKFAGSQMPPTS